MKRTAIYIITFLLLVGMVLAFADLKAPDRFLVNSFSKAGNPDNSLDKQIAVIHLKKPSLQNEGLTTKFFRQDIVRLLNTIALQATKNIAPKAIVLDIWFANDTTELFALEGALKKLKDLKVPVYAAYNINEKHAAAAIDEIDFDELETKHAIDIYNQYLAGSSGKSAGSGRYHTFFYPDKDVLTYENDVYLTSSLFDSVLIESLTRKVYADLSHSAVTPLRVGSVVPLRNTDQVAGKTWVFRSDSTGTGSFYQNTATASNSFEMNNQILIVGNIDDDLVPAGAKKIPGPYIVAWALSDLLSNNTVVNLPVENLFIIIAQLFFFSAVAIAVFALLFKYVKKLQTKPGVIALLSFFITALLFAVYGMLLLGFKTIVPISHTLIAVTIACLLAWRYASRFLTTGIAEGSNKYDVFISYSRGEADWVEKNVYLPLSQLRKANGEKLTIFFDKKSIGWGEAFTAKYMWAIVDTKHFLAVLSDDYYSKNHCRNELDCAVKRKVEQLITLHMLAYTDNCVPEAYNGFNYMLRDKHPDFIMAIKDKLVYSF